MRRPSELAFRRNPASKAILADIADHFERNQPHRVAGQSLKKDEVDRLGERNVRNNARIALAKWGDEKYFQPFVVELSTTDVQIKLEAIKCLQEIGNRAAIKYLVRQFDDKTVWKSAPDVFNPPVGAAAATAVNVLLGSQNIPKAVPFDDKFYDHWIAYWKQWWQQNKTQYQNMSFNDGWPQPK